MKNKSLILIVLHISQFSCRLVGHVGKIQYSPTLHFHPRITNNNINNNNNIMNETAQASDVEDHGSRRCYKKVVMVEEMKFDTVETCNHNYKKECHTSYMTKFKPYQQEECKVQFKKSCHIKTSKKTVKQMMEVCRTPMVKVCPDEDDDVDKENEVCQTVYEPECWTKYEKHEVEDDIPQCVTVNMTKCDESGENCEDWPREECKVVRQKVMKTTPKTGCDKVPKTMCTSRGCHLAEGAVECHHEPRSMLLETPEEECELNPVRQCRPVTKMIPQLVPTTACMDVPRETCSQSKVNPRKVKRPVIRKVCFKKDEEEDDNEDDSNDDETDGNNDDEENETTTDPTTDCSLCSENSNICDIQNFPYTSCSHCHHNKCQPGCASDDNCPQEYKCVEGVCRSGPGKVLINSINIKTLSCVNCDNDSSAGVTLSLRGEVIGEFLDGVPCSTNTLEGVFTDGGVTTVDGDHEDGTVDVVEEEQMATCYKVRGGTLRWGGSGQWTPDNVCVDWRSSNMAYTCSTMRDETEDTWSLVHCTDLTPIQDCQHFYNQLDQ